MFYELRGVIGAPQGIYAQKKNFKIFLEFLCEPHGHKRYPGHVGTSSNLKKILKIGLEFFVNRVES